MEYSLSNDDFRLKEKNGTFLRAIIFLFAFLFLLCGLFISRYFIEVEKVMDDVHYCISKSYANNNNSLDHVIKDLENKYDGLHIISNVIEGHPYTTLHCTYKMSTADFTVSLNKQIKCCLTTLLHIKIKINEVKFIK